jgi:hypothetical protein
MTVVLTATVERRPYSSAELADTITAGAVAECERMGGGTPCRDIRTPGEPQDRFSRDSNERVYVFVTLKNLEPRRSYECRARFFGPDGGVFARVTQRMLTSDRLPLSYELFVIFESGTRAMRPGRWKVEVAVNGEVEAERTFEVIGSTRT